MTIPDKLISKYYRYARSIAGSLGDDLLHHVIIKIHSKTIVHIDSYIYRTLVNEFQDKSSSFNKLYRPKSLPEVDTNPTGGYDVNKIHPILLKMEMEGYEMEVKVFKTAYFVTSESELARAMKVDRETVRKICTFVKNRIKDEY